MVIRLLLLCLPLTLAAQQPLQYTRLSAENGLSNNSVQCILQDRSGIVWIGTNGGLNRYDGSSFIQYSMLSTPALSNSVVTALMQDEDGYVWIGTENGLNILHPINNTVQRFSNDPLVATSLPAGVIRSVQKMPGHVIWVLSDTWIMQFNNRASFQVVQLDSSLLQQYMVLMAVHASGPDKVWLSYLDHPAVLVHRSTIKGQVRLEKVVCSTTDHARIFTDDKNATISISGHGLGHFIQQEQSFAVGLKNEYAPPGAHLHMRTCYAIDAGGNVWQGTDKAGLVKYDLQQKRVIDCSWLLSTANATLVFCLYRDNNNNIWVGTDNGVLCISNRASIFKNLSFAPKGVPLRDIRCRRIKADRLNNLYAATENYGLLKRTPLPDGRDTTRVLSAYGALAISNIPHWRETLTLKLSGQYDIGYIYDMWYDGNDHIWLTGYGLSRYNILNDSLELFLDGTDAVSLRESVQLFALCFDGRQFWAAGQYNLYTFDPATQKLTAFKDRKGNALFHQLPCWSLVHIGDWIWAGTNKGLFKVHIHTREVVKLNIHPVLGFGVNDICEDKDGSVWLSTMGGGIVHYNEHTGAVKQYTSRDGLNNNIVCGMLQDDNHNLWISTYAGLSYFDRNTSQFTCFYARDGLNIDEFNRKAFTRLKDGRMIFGGMNGYNVFDPAEAFTSDRPVNIVLTRFTKTTGSGATEEIVFDTAALKQVTIEPNDKFFSFHYTLTDMYDPPGNHYRYMIEGLDNTWHSIGNQSFVSFNTLPAGSYTLRIKGSPGKGAESINEISVRIVVKQVFYKTWWFLLLSLAAAAAAVYGIVRYRINQVKKIQFLRTRIASDLHDEVGSSLTHITMLADMVKRAGDKEVMDEQLTGIAGISRGAVATMKDIIWSIDARYDTMDGMVSHMRDHVHQVLAPADIEFVFDMHGLQGQDKLQADFRQQVYLIFKEAINNIVKHAQARFVHITLKKEEGLFVMEIKDNGRGIDPQHHSSGQGLSNMEMRAARLKGAVKVVSVNGVTVRLEVPL